MKSVTLQEIQTWHSGIQKYLTLTFDGGLVINNSMIVAESASLEHSICDDNQLEFGTVAAASFTVKIISTASQSTLQGQGFTASITCGEYTRDIGRFIVESDEKSSDRRFRTLECYDELYGVLNEDFTAWHNGLNLSNVSTIGAYRNAFFSYLTELGYAVTQEQTTLPCDGVSIVTIDQGGHPVANFVADGYSGQDVLFSICQANACFGIIDTDGVFKYIRPATIDQSAQPSQSYPTGAWQVIGDPTGRYSPYVQGSLDFEEYYTETITMVSVRQTEKDLGGQYGTEGATYSIIGNPLFFNKKTAELNSIAQLLLPFIHNVTYMPMEFKTPACPWVDIGDGISVNSHYGYAQTVLLRRTMNGITALMEEYDVDGTRTRSDNANNQQKSILVLNQKTNEMVRTVDENTFRISQVETTVNGEITQEISTLTQTVAGLEVKVEESVSGFFFNVVPTDNGDGTVTMDAHFYLGQSDVTRDYDAKNYNWYKKTEEGRVYIGYGYSITVVKEDFGYGGEVEAVFTLLSGMNAETTQGRWVFTIGGVNYNAVIGFDEGTGG